MLRFTSASFVLFSVVLLNILISASDAKSQDLQLDEHAVDETVQRALAQFHTPGMSVAIVHENQVVYQKGFGLANVEANTKVNPDTYFRLASTSKAFTAAALAILVDQGKVRWDDLVIDYLPNFRLQDDYATRHFTVEDLLTHKSGLAGGAGDSMIWPEPSGFSRKEVVHNLRFLSPEYQFRQRYAYSNVMYITAGELVEALSGEAFDEFVDKYIFAPLGMRCFTGKMPEDAVKQSAMSYGYTEQRGRFAIPRNAIYGEAQMSAAAGGMVCNASGMAKWLQALMKTEKLPFSTTQLEKMWQPHTILGVSETDLEWDGTHFRSYGLGWRLANYGPYKHISHTGTLSGYQAFVALIPEKELGVVILNNGSNYGARGSVMQSILKQFIDAEQSDWVQRYQDYQDEREQAYLDRNIQAPVASVKMTIQDEDIEGTYRDQWFGDLVITQQEGELRIYSTRMSGLSGKIEPFQESTYKIVWDNQNAASDAFMHFDLSVQREIRGARLHPFTVQEQNNHEWRDMYFKRQE